MVPKAQIFLAVLAFVSVACIAAASAGDVLLHRWQRSGISQTPPTIDPKTSPQQPPTVKKLAPNYSGSKQKSSSGWTGWSNFYRSF
jgi:hypothetical protein